MIEIIIVYTNIIACILYFKTKSRIQTLLLSAFIVMGCRHAVFFYFIRFSRDGLRYKGYRVNGKRAAD